MTERKRLTLVLAGSYRQYEQWCWANGLNPRDRTSQRYVGDPMDCRAISSDYEVRILIHGTFWDRRDAVELYEWASRAERTSMSFDQ